MRLQLMGLGSHGHGGPWGWELGRWGPMGLEGRGWGIMGLGVGGPWGWGAMQL